MGIDVGLSEVDRIEVVFEEVNNEDITVELVDNPVTIELETPPEIQVAVNEIYSDVNVILDHDKLINRNLNKQHTAETIQESTSKRFTSDTEIDSKANQIDLTNHINDLNNPHETGINNLEGFPTTPTLTKFLRDDKSFAEIVAGSGGYAANVYLTNLDSDVLTYKKISYSVESTETVISTTATNESKLVYNYVYDSGVGVTNLDEGAWDFFFTCKLDVVNSSNRIKTIIFKRDTSNVETDLINTYSSELINTDYLQIRFQNIQQNIPVLSTDRIGIRVYFETTNTNPVIFNLKVGDGNASYFTTPLALRHSQLRLPNEDLNVQHLTNAEKTQGALATGNSTLDTVKKVADKAQFAPNENGTILYHTAKWFTPTGTISTNGITATSTSSQFTSAMVGAKLIILGEDRIIVSYISGSQVTVNSDYSQNYNSIGVNNWGVYNIMYRELPNGDQVWYTINSYTPYMKLTYYGTTSIYEFYQLNNYFSFFDSFRSKSNFHFRWASGNSYIGTYDIGFNRNSAGVLEINDGNTAGTYRDVNLRNLNYYGTLNNASDERLKHDIRPVNDGLEKVCILAECVKHFEFNNQDIYAKGQRTGFIAQLLKANGFEGHVTEREPANEDEGTLFGWTYKDEEYEELNQETQEAKIKIRRVVDVKGDMVLQVENNFSPYLYPAIAELKKQNDELRSELDLIKQKLGIL